MAACAGESQPWVIEWHKKVRYGEWDVHQIAKKCERKLSTLLIGLKLNAWPGDMNQRVIAHLSLTCLILVNLIPYKVGGCLSQQKNIARRSNGRLEISLGRHYEFLTFDDVGSSGMEAFSITKGVYVSNTTPVYGRVEVPYEMSGGGFVLTVGAHWRRRRSNSPVWLYIKKSGLPSVSSWDNKSVSYVSRKYARLRLNTPTPGVYYVMIRGDADESDLTVTASLLPRGHPHAGDARWRVGRRMGMSENNYFQTSGETLVLRPPRHPVKQTPWMDDFCCVVCNKNKATAGVACTLMLGWKLLKGIFNFMNLFLVFLYSFKLKVLKIGFLQVSSSYFCGITYTFSVNWSVLTFFSELILTIFPCIQYYYHQVIKCQLITTLKL